MESVKKVKAAWRKNSRETRDSFYGNFLAQKSLDHVNDALVANLNTLIPKTPAVWASYRAIGSEADPHSVVKFSKWISWVFPRIEGDQLKFYQPLDEHSFHANKWNILEPIPEKSSDVALDDVDGFIVPGLVFDRHGGRLGNGRGYYDRTLKGLRAKKIGLGYSVQIVEQVPRDEHDVLMDHVVTETAVYSCRPGLDKRGN